MIKYYEHEYSGTLLIRPYMIMQNQINYSFSCINNPNFVTLTPTIIFARNAFFSHISKIFYSLCLIKIIKTQLICVQVTSKGQCTIDR